LMGIDISGSLKTGIPLLGSGTPQDTIYGVYGGLARWLKRFERVHPREKAVARKSPESMIPGETESEPL
ncbi:MAG: hypothetical protein NTV04_19085, partial [Deltaproteobacteria bacterium]|nr:hypothetical protein [Deltaproteobacteria bacterium]